MKVFLWVLCLIVVSLGASSETALSTRVLSLDPVGEHSCVAAPIQLDSGQALIGLEWFNNDSTVPFPRLLLMEGVPGLPPDLSQTGYILYDVDGAELAATELEFPVALTSSTGFIWAVWVLPEESATSGLGDGEGPGLGLEDASDPMPFYVSGDGVSWMRWAGNQRLMVESRTTGGAARTTFQVATLADLAESVQYGAPEPDPDVTSPTQAPAVFRFEGASPNPFNPLTTISFELAAGASVTLSVYNVRGQLVRELLDESLPAGPHAVQWNGVDHRGRQLASGVYYARILAGGLEATRRLTLVR